MSDGLAGQAALTGRTATNLTHFARLSFAKLSSERTIMKKIILSALFCALSLPIFARDCSRILGPQKADTASVKKAEDAWDEAFLHGSAEYLQCLLTPDYASVSPEGSHDKARELGHASKNKGSSAPIPDFPGMTFQVHGTTAIARLFHPASADGKQPASYAADIFTFQDGAWHAVYSQHTTVEAAAK
jgi:hypothetical protein